MSKKIISIRAIIFDLDGVITNTMPDHYRAWREFSKKYNIPITRNEVYLREGQPGIMTIKEIASNHDIEMPHSRAKKLMQEKENFFKSIVKLRFIQGARQLLKDLDRKDFTLALVSGTYRDEINRMLPKSILRYFKNIISGSDVKIGKPHPEPFLKSLKNLKISNKDAIVIENTPFGIRSAKGAGLKVIALCTSLPKVNLREADYIFSTIKEMNEKLEFKFKK